MATFNTRIERPNQPVKRSVRNRRTQRAILLKLLQRKTVKAILKGERLESLVNPRGQQGEVIPFSEAMGNDKLVVNHAAAYEPDARARAILRGKDMAKADLEAAGGTYRVEEVRKLLNSISRQAVHKKVQEGHLLTVPGPGDDLRYPTAQFMGDGTVVPGLKAVQEALPTKNRWAILNYFVQPDSLLNGRKPLDLLKEGQVDLVVESARRYGEMGS